MTSFNIKHYRVSNIDTHNKDLILLAEDYTELKQLGQFSNHNHVCKNEIAIKNDRYAKHLYPKHPIANSLEIWFMEYLINSINTDMAFFTVKINTINTWFETLIHCWVI